MDVARMRMPVVDFWPKATYRRPASWTRCHDHLKSSRCLGQCGCRFLSQNDVSMSGERSPDLMPKFLNLKPCGAVVKIRRCTDLAPKTTKDCELLAQGNVSPSGELDLAPRSSKSSDAWVVDFCPKTTYRRLASEAQPCGAVVKIRRRTDLAPKTALCTFNLVLGVFLLRDDVFSSREQGLLSISEAMRRFEGTKIPGRKPRQVRLKVPWIRKWLVGEDARVVGCEERILVLMAGSSYRE
ncbi:hypothetical protein EDD85DRAFT_1029307 [Armillaria nabsnona]|nr:hypothetical protein EDD85DRAFT_1029307 [Armillaria nabsnona]